jgi:hypothetical protein
LNHAAHAQLVTALRGDQQSLLSVRDNTLWLDLTPLLARGVDALREQVPALSLVLRPVPSRDPNAAAQSGRQDLSAAIGHALPADFGEVALVRSAQLATLQWAARSLEILVLVVPIAAVAAVAATLWLARHRARVVAVLGLEVAIVFGLMYIVLNRTVTTYAASAGDAATVAVSHAVLGQLLRFNILAIGIGLAVAVIGLVVSLTAARSDAPPRSTLQAGPAG